MGVYADVRRALRELDMKFREPAGIIFSHHGFMKARMEDRDGTGFSGDTTTYMGLPYRVDHQQEADVRLVDTEEVQGGIRLQVRGVHDDPERCVQEVVLIGRALTERQLADLVMAHCQPHIDAGTQTPFQRALHSAVVNFGRFE